MIAKFTEQIENCRIRTGKLASDECDGRNGAFVVYLEKQRLQVIVSDAISWKENGLFGHPWEHVSVSTPSRCPTWEEMCFVKNLFFHPEETVIQIHPPKSEYVNFHNFCLHLWRPIGQTIPLPPSITVGPK